MLPFRHAVGAVHVIAAQPPFSLEVERWVRRDTVLVSLAGVAAAPDGLRGPIEKLNASSSKYVVAPSGLYAQL